MKSMMILYFFLTAMIAGSCERNDNNPEGPLPVPLSQKSLALLETGNSFSFDFFREVALSAEEGKNLMVSPLSVSLALGMTYNGAAGDTQTAMEEALRMQGFTPEEINQAYSEVMNILMEVDPKVAMQIANSIWYRNTVSVKQDFISTNEPYYDAEVSALDFNSPASVGNINNWVSDKTNGKITEIIDQINPLDIMFLINAIYFKGTWMYRFDENATSDLPFYLSGGGQEEVPTMYMQADVEAFRNDLVQGIRLPYGSNNFGMMVLLPGENKTPADLAAALTPETWSSWLNSLGKVNEMKIFLPRFKYSFRMQLKEVLAAMGMGIAFDPQQADFSGINDEMELYISSVLQKTFVEVNEEGTEAAAVTAVTVGTTSIGPINEFRADHPFLFVIYEQVTGAILFMGQVNNPLLEE